MEINKAKLKNLDLIDWDKLTEQNEHYPLSKNLINNNLKKMIIPWIIFIDNQIEKRLKIPYSINLECCIVSKRQGMREILADLFCITKAEIDIYKIKREREK